MNNKFLMCIILTLIVSTALTARSKECRNCCEYNNYKSNQQLAQAIAWTQSSVDLTAPYAYRGKAWSWQSY